MSKGLQVNINGKVLEELNEDCGLSYLDGKEVKVDCISEIFKGSYAVRDGEKPSREKLIQMCVKDFFGADEDWANGFTVKQIYRERIEENLGDLDNYIHLEDRYVVRINFQLFGQGKNSKDL
jgi:hypothetical protein